MRALAEMSQLVLSSCLMPANIGTETLCRQESGIFVHALFPIAVECRRHHDPACVVFIFDNL